MKLKSITLFALVLGLIQIHFAAAGINRSIGKKNHSTLQRTMITSAVFFNNFETGTVDGWQSHPSSDTTSEQSYSGRFCMKLNDNGTSNLAELWKTFDEMNQGVTELWAYIPSGNGAPVGICLCDNSGTEWHPGHRFLLVLRENGLVEWRNTDEVYQSLPVPTTLSLDEWHRFLLVWDALSNNMDIYIDGTARGTVENARDGGLISQLRFQSGSTPATNVLAYFDDVGVSASDIAWKNAFSFTNFESGTVDGWQSHPSSDTTSEQSYSGRFCLKLNDNGASNLAELWKTFNPIDNGMVEFWINYSSNNDAPVGICLCDDSGTEWHPGHRFLLVLRENGLVEWRNTDEVYQSLPVPTTLSLDEWHRFLLVWDAISNNLDIYIDGTARGTVENARDGGLISQLRFQSGSTPATNVVTYFDDIWIYTENYPTSISQWDSFEEAAIPTDFALSQNYPNPFNPETTIEYQLPETANVVLSIFNVQGQLVQQLVAGTKSPGTHQIRWNALDINGQSAPTGIYFYKIDAKSSYSQRILPSQTKSMILMK